MAAWCSLNPGGFVSGKPISSISPPTHRSTAGEGQASDEAVPGGVGSDTIAVIQNLRFCDIPYAALENRIADVIKEDPVLGHELNEVQRKELIDALLDLNNRDERVGDLLEGAVHGARLPTAADGLAGESSDQ